jgi:gluconokinase
LPVVTVIVVVMGVSGAGKTTIGRALAQARGWEFVEGDDLHPPANVAKMSRGEPLSDTDRAPWLQRLRALIAEHLAQGRDAVISCSALKRDYRRQLQIEPAEVRFVYLHGDDQLIRRRLAQRRGHFMPPELIESQLLTLEPPNDAIEVDAAWPIDHSVQVIIEALRRKRGD